MSATSSSEDFAAKHAVITVLSPLLTIIDRRPKLLVNGLWLLHRRRHLAGEGAREVGSKEIVVND